MGLWFLDGVDLDCLPEEVTCEFVDSWDGSLDVTSSEDGDLDRLMVEFVELWRLIELMFKLSP